MTCQRCMIERRIANFRQVEQELLSPYSTGHPDELVMARRAYDSALELLPGYEHTCKGSGPALLSQPRPGTGG